MGGCECNCTNKQLSDNELQLNLGKDFEGIEEVHHFHQEHGMNKKQSYQDLFYRQCFKPMHLMKVEAMFRMIDEICQINDQQEKDAIQSLAAEKTFGSSAQMFFSGNTQKSVSQNNDVSQHNDESECDDSEEMEYVLDFKTVPILVVYQYLEQQFHFKNDIKNEDSAIRQMLVYNDIFSRFVLDKHQKLLDESMNAQKPKMNFSFENQLKDVLQAGITDNIDQPTIERSWSKKLLYYKSQKEEQEENKRMQQIQNNLKKKSYRAHSLEQKKEICQHVIYTQGFGIQDISQWNEINFQEMATTQTSKYQTRQLDVYQLQSTALLLCRGTVEEKAKMLVKLVTQSSNKSQSSKKVYWENPYLKRTIKLMFYLSVILPYKFMMQMKDSEVLRDIILHENSSFKTPEKRKSQKADNKVKEFLDNQYENVLIMKAEQNFDKVFSDIYEDHIIGYIFKTQSILSQEDFIQKISPKLNLLDFTKGAKKVKRKQGNIHKAILPLNNEEDMLWLFSPVHLRKLFYDELELFLEDQKEGADQANKANEANDGDETDE